MKFKNFLLAPVIFTLACSVKPTVTSVSKASFTVTHSFVGDTYAQLTFSDGYFGTGFEHFSYPKTPLVAGDYFEIEYTGDLIVQESFPCNYIIQGGEVVSTKFIPTTIHKATKDYLNKETNLDFFSTRVILSSQGDWEYILDYQGDELYYTLDMGYYEENRCPEGAVCEELPIVIAGVYAYNPRI